jgi:hypothetical protein
LVPVRGVPDALWLFYGRRKSTGMARSELPTVATMMLEVVHGHGGVVFWSGEKCFDVLVWQSHIPLYASYVGTCDMERTTQVEADKKQPLNKRRRDPTGSWLCCSGEDKLGL